MGMVKFILYPEQTRDNHSNFIGKDKYFEMRKLF
jgi:hypothetical protein